MCWLGWKRSTGLGCAMRTVRRVMFRGCCERWSRGRPPGAGTPCTGCTETSSARAAGMRQVRTRCRSWRRWPLTRGHCNGMRSCICSWRWPSGTTRRTCRPGWISPGGGPASGGCARRIRLGGCVNSTRGPGRAGTRPAAGSAACTGRSMIPRSGIAAFPVAAAALRLAFPRGAPHPLPPYSQLAEPQQRVVRTLAGLGSDTWRWGNFMLILRAWNLPSAHGECRACAGLGAP
jgi:hypothetical protein